MYDLFSKADNLKMVERIKKIDPSSKASWGKMDAAGMLFHLQEPIRVSLGKLKLKRGLVGILFGKMALKQVLSDKPFKKSVPTSKEFKPRGSYDLEKEKEKLIQLVASLAEKDPDAISSEPHPFFGKLTSGQWNTITWKHLDHHLTQFGA
jgi:hypothetical protein